MKENYISISINNAKRMIELYKSLGKWKYRKKIKEWKYKLNYWLNVESQQSKN